jgi:hypothetical protein
MLASTVCVPTMSSPEKIEKNMSTFATTFWSSYLLLAFWNPIWLAGVGHFPA